LTRLLKRSFKIFDSQFQQDTNNFKNAPGVDILQKRPKNAQEGINSAQAKFTESSKKVFVLPRNEEIMCFLP